MNCYTKNRKRIQNGEKSFLYPFFEQDKVRRWLFPKWKYPLHTVDVILYAFVLAVSAFFFQLPLL